MVKKEDINALLERRREIIEEVNKLQREYAAIGNVVEDILKRREEEKTKDERF